MTVKDLLDNFYAEDPYLKKLKEKLPEFYRYADKVMVLDWRPEFAIADVNVEVQEEKDFWRTLYEGGLIDKREYEERTSHLNRVYTSKTLGIAFMDDDEVAFRGFYADGTGRKPSLAVVLHELGHCYFKEPDPIWSDDYAGGETLMKLILTDRYDGSMSDLEGYMKLRRELYTNPWQAMDRLNEAAKNLIRKYRLSEQEVYSGPYRSLVDLCWHTGYIPHMPHRERELSALGFDVLANALISIAHEDWKVLWVEFFKDVLGGEKVRKNALRR